MYKSYFALIILICKVANLKYNYQIYEVEYTSFKTVRSVE